jgi:hypothetical protein
MAASRIVLARARAGARAGWGWGWGLKGTSGTLLCDTKNTGDLSFQAYYALHDTRGPISRLCRNWRPRSPSVALCAALCGHGRRRGQRSSGRWHSHRLRPPSPSPSPSLLPSPFSLLPSPPQLHKPVQYPYRPDATATHADADAGGVERGA